MYYNITCYDILYYSIVPSRRKVQQDVDESTRDEVEKAKVLNEASESIYIYI